MCDEIIIKTNIKSKEYVLDYSNDSETSIESIQYSSISEEAFIKNYYLPEKPVLLKGIRILKEEMCNPEYIRKRFWDDTLKRPGWYSAPLPNENDDIKVPPIYRTLCNNDDTLVHETPMRVWMHSKGNITPWHYDLGGCHGFNAQVKGSKRWVIVSPQTPLPSVPLTHLGAVGVDFVPNSNKTTYYEFTTNPGDLLFIPRGWSHTVQTLEDVSINLNWLLTPVKPNLDTPVGRRECEIIKLLNTYLSILIVKKKDDENSEDMVQNFIMKNISSTAAFIRLLKELCKLPRALFTAPKLVSALRNYVQPTNR
ncbi:MAG: cupin-like domain-containing protein [Pseudomonadales bacterium]|nr:cupin-like domain-containing protein [Pseudomonadales bacterium]